MNLSLIKQGVRHMFLQDTLITLLSPLIVRSLSSPRSKRMGLRSLSRLSDVLPPLKVVGFLRVLRFPTSGKVDRVG